MPVYPGHVKTVLWYNDTHEETQSRFPKEYLFHSYASPMNEGSVKFHTDKLIKANLVGKDRFHRFKLTDFGKWLVYPLRENFGRFKSIEEYFDRVLIDLRANAFLA